MTTERVIFVDEGPGETRVGVFLNEAPERLLIEREGEAHARLGARHLAHVAKTEKALGLAWLDLGEGLEAALRFKSDRPAPVEGQKLQVEISIEAQGAKPAVARVLGEGQGTPGLLEAAPSLEQRLRVLAPEAELIVGRTARDMADEAQAGALETRFDLRGGGSIAIERTRALTAVDVDVGAASGGDSKRAARAANLKAIAETARILRLKAQGGLVIVDLAGQGHDGQAITQALRTAFAPDQPGAVFGPISRFGVIELALPRRWRPLADILCDQDGRPSTATLGFALLRAVEREAAADPGARLVARARPEVVAAAARGAQRLAQRIGARFELREDPALSRAATEIGRL